MTNDDQGAPAEPDLLRPSPARIYDYMLGGSHNFAVDREVAETALAAHPQMRQSAMANRSFLRRAVTACLESGIRQFLDVGSGIPSVGNVHDIARAHDPAARVAYVDSEPVAVEHSRTVLAGLDGVSITHADLRDPRRVLAAPGVAGVLDLDRPFALLAVSVLHFVPHADDLPAILAGYRSAMAPGSMLVCSHGTTDLGDPEAAESMRTMERLTRGSSQPANARDLAALAEACAGFRLLEPGMVDVVDWRPEPGESTRPTGMCGFVGVL